MSGVATLKLRGAKRHFDEMAVDLPVPPQACSPSRYPLRPPPLKRGRCAPSPISTPLRPPASSVSVAVSSNTPPSTPTPTTPTLTANTAKNLLPHLSAHNPSSPAVIKYADNNNDNNDSNNDSSNIDSSKLSAPSSTPHQPNSPSSPDVAKEASQNDRLLVSAEDLAALARHLPRRLKRVIERLAAGQVATSERLFTLADLKEIVNSVFDEREAKLREQFTLTLNERLAEQFRDFTKFNEDYVSRQLRGTDLAYLS